MPDSSFGQAAVEYRGSIYVFGGITSADLVAQNTGTAFDRYARELPPIFSDVRAYDPALDAWTRKASMPRGLSGLTAHVLADKVYVFGGYGENGFDATVQEYDLATDTWRLREPMPTQRTGFSSQEIGGKVYVVGGNGPDPLAPDGAIEWPYTDAVEIFDPSSGWTSGSPMRRPVGGAASCSMGSRMYVFGGDINNFTSIYDGQTDTWTRGTAPPVERRYHACVRVADAFYLLGGRTPDGGSGILDLVEKYDPATDTWSTLGRMPLTRTSLSAVSLDLDVFAFGGIVQDGTYTPLSTDRVELLHIDTP